MVDFKGLATGIGSLPYRNAEDALDLIFKHTPRAPFWPQLPKRNACEGMVAQFSQNLPCLRIKDGSVYLDPEAPERELEIFYEKIIAGDNSYFGITPDFAPGIYAYRERLRKSGAKGVDFVKGHITGPFTFAAAVTDDKGVALLHNEILMQAVIKGLACKAKWQVEFLKEFGRQAIIFVDEPYLGCFGSAYTPITRSKAVEVLNELCSDIKTQGALTGVHCCGNTDWSILTEAAGVDIISFDAFNFMDRLVLYAPDVSSFLARGGILCWGIAPTREFTGEEDPGLLAGKIRSGMEMFARKGVDAEKLSERLIISPSCGLGSLDEEKAEGIFSLLSATAGRLVRC
ncbi:MAG: methionine synthase [Candidatus Omnitrophota bacterium]